MLSGTSLQSPPFSEAGGHPTYHMTSQIIDELVHCGSEYPICAAKIGPEEVWLRFSDERSAFAAVAASLGTVATTGKPSQVCCRYRTALSRH